MNHFVVQWFFKRRWKMRKVPETSSLSIFFFSFRVETQWRKGIVFFCFISYLGKMCLETFLKRDGHETTKIYISMAMLAKKRTAAALFSKKMDSRKFWQIYNLREPKIIIPSHFHKNSLLFFIFLEIGKKKCIVTRNQCYGSSFHFQSIVNQVFKFREINDILK